MVLQAAREFQRNDLLVTLTSEQAKAWALDMVTARAHCFDATQAELDRTADHLLLWLIGQPSVIDRIVNA